LHQLGSVDQPQAAVVAPHVLHPQPDEGGEDVGAVLTRSAVGQPAGLRRRVELLVLVGAVHRLASTCPLSRRATSPASSWMTMWPAGRTSRRAVGISAASVREWDTSTQRSSSAPITSV